MVSSFWNNDFWDSLEVQAMVFKATTNQPYVTLVHPTDPKNLCAESLYPFSFHFLEWKKKRKRNRSQFEKSIQEITPLLI